jgi:hypothetical protein
VCWRSDAHKRREFPDAIVEARDAWRQAYVGDDPTPPDAAVMRLLRALAENAGIPMLIAG